MDTYDYSYFYENIPNRLKEARKYRGYNQDEVANMLCVALSTYQKWEQGVSRISNEDTIRFANLLNISLDYIFSRSRNPEINKD